MSGEQTPRTRRTDCGGFSIDRCEQRALLTLAHETAEEAAAALVAAGWAHDDLCALFGLSALQLDVALTYIERHLETVEAEYRDVVRQAEASRRYWDERNRERLVALDARSSVAEQGQDTARTKLRAWRQRLISSL